jgi:hypothetical protein
MFESEKNIGEINDPKDSATRFKAKSNLAHASKLHERLPLVL